MFSPKGPEWIIILVVVLLIFGARKLPELARSLGASAKEFRKGILRAAQKRQRHSEAPPRLRTQLVRPPEAVQAGTSHGSRALRHEVLCMRPSSHWEEVGGAMAGKSTLRYRCRATRTTPMISSGGPFAGPRRYGPSISRVF